MLSPKDGSKYDCIDEPFKVNADGTCQEDASYYCADSFMLKNKCGNDTQMCCQFKSSGAVINSSCLGLGTFITDEATGLCSEGTPLSYTYDYCADDNKKKSRIVLPRQLSAVASRVTTLPVKMPNALRTLCC